MTIVTIVDEDDNDNNIDCNKKDKHNIKVTVKFMTVLMMNSKKGACGLPGAGGEAACSAQEGDLHAAGIAVHHLLLLCVTPPHAVAVVPAHACT